MTLMRIPIAVVKFLKMKLQRRTKEKQVVEIAKIQYHQLNVLRGELFVRMVKASEIITGTPTSVYPPTYYKRHNNGLKIPDGDIYVKSTNPCYNEITEDVERIPDSVPSVTLVESGIDSSVEETCDDERKIRETKLLLVKLNCLIQDKEDFGKRNISGKRARTHFSQLSEFDRGLIIGMKTAGWSTCRVAGQVDRSECVVRNCGEQWRREGTPAFKTEYGATRKTTRRADRRIVWQALLDPTVTRSTIRADAGVAFVPQTISRHLAEANLKSKRLFRALPITPDHRQLRLQWCQARSMWNVTD
ncbi:transposable element Tc1 transposase [Trichonephila clavipes]|nr:transposable element Tc1 transposase [Trichonephila clavipes]